MDCFVAYAPRNDGKILPDGQISKFPVQSSHKKYSAFAVGQITAKDSRILSREEGRWPSSRTLGQVAVDVDALLTNGAEAYGEDVWS
jgi:hypothetical protein